MMRSLKGKMLLALAGLVLLSCLAVTGVASQRLAAGLRASLRSLAENQAQSLALQAADLILINDLVALQKLLHHARQGHPEIAYIFVLQEGQVLAGTLPGGVPGELATANAPKDSGALHAKELRSTQGEAFLDIAMPVFEGKAGILRLGVSEQLLMQQIREMWLEIAALSAVILFCALLGGALFARRLTRPLEGLVRAARELDARRFDVRAPVSGNDELAEVAGAFNHMAQRVQDYVTRMEEQAADLESLYSRLSRAYEVIQGAAGLSTLRDLGSFIMRTVQEHIVCSNMLLLLFDSTRSGLFCVTQLQCIRHAAPEVVEALEEMLQGLPAFSVGFARSLPADLVPEFGADAARQGIIPLHSEGRSCGCLVIFCPGQCRCNLLEAEFVGLILAHATAMLLRAAQHEEEIRRLTAQLDSVPEFCGMVGRDPSMQAVFSLIEDVAPTDATVLIQGESGTGKELAARAIHDQSPRRDRPFIVINCSAYPETLLESELFGHEKGAFTGAVKQRGGRFEQAHGGTVFLDEIGEVPLPAQVKLLRVLQTRQLERLGSDKTLDVDVRIIAATNKALAEEVQAGRFREDLYYRLDVVSLRLPPLRERGNDVALLAGHFLELASGRAGRSVEGFAPQTLRLLLDYDWPGNVRELENVVEQAVVVAKGGLIHPADLPARLRNPQSVPVRSTMQEQERQLLLQTLADCAWNRTHAAERLGIGRSTLYAKLRKFRIQVPGKLSA